jgi:hypothetical protein
MSCPTDVGGLDRTLSLTHRGPGCGFFQGPAAVCQVNHPYLTRVSAAVEPPEASQPRLVKRERSR